MASPSYPCLTFLTLDDHATTVNNPDATASNHVISKPKWESLVFKTKNIKFKKQKNQIKSITPKCLFPFSIRLIQPHLSPLTSQLYTGISQAPWFTWNSTTAAELTALLHSLGRHSQSESLIFDASSKLQPCQCDLVLFYGKLIDSHSKRNSHTAFDAAFGYLHNLVRTSSSLHVKRMAYQYMVSYLCLMDRPCEAEDLVLGLQPSSFIVRAWGIRVRVY